MNPEQAVDQTQPTSNQQPDRAQVSGQSWLAKVVFLRRNIGEPFEYLVDAGDLVGCPVIVPLGPKLTVGIVIDVNPAQNPPDEIKQARDVVSSVPPLPESLIELGRWISDYYACPLNTVFESIMPPRYLPEPEPAWRRTNKQPSDEHFISELDKNRSYTLEDLQDHLDLNQSGIVERMDELSDDGLVESTLNVTPASVSRRELNFVQLVERDRDWELILEEASKRQEQLLNHLQNNGDTFQRELPEPLRRSSLLQKLEDDGYVDRFKKPIQRNPLPDEVVDDGVDPDSISLTDDQDKVLSSIEDSIAQSEHKPHLIHGVTGSGKTEVYFRLAQSALERNRSVLILVPEITLASFQLGRFKHRFEDDLAVVHSGLSSGERLDEWRRIRDGEARVVLGVQSAVFAPLEDLGLIIVDEEHDSSYKAGQSPRYNARDVAVQRARQGSIPVVLGSATPSLESVANVHRDRYTRHPMKTRPAGGELPDVDLVDLRDEDNLLTDSLIERTGQVLDQDRRAIWFLNRRGFSNFILCQDCGETAMCQNCNVTLTLHDKPRRLRCHYCGYQQDVPDRCDECQSPEVESVGQGTQHVAAVAEDWFDDSNVIRMDADTVSKKNARFDLLRQFGEQPGSLLVGTQMVTKGLDYSDVDLVGVLNVDLGLRFPDFRSAEHTFQQLVQVCGRAGRTHEGAGVLVQSYNPGHYAVQLGMRREFERFHKIELNHRKPLGYPPFSRMINIIARGKQEQKLPRLLNKILHQLPEDDQISRMGPAPCGIDYRKGKYRWHLLLRGSINMSFRRQLLELLKQTNTGPNSVIVDADPVEMS